MASDADFQRTKRLLRQRIGRLRRRIDGRVHRLGRQGRRLASWKTYVTRYPAYAVLVALGFGLAASAGLRRGALTRTLGLLLLRRATGKTVDAILAELKAVWTEAAPDRPPSDAEGADHGRS